MFQRIGKLIQVTPQVRGALTKRWRSAALAEEIFTPENIIVPVFEKSLAYPILEESRFVVDCAKYNLKHEKEIPSSLIAEVNEKFNNSGVVHFVNTGLTEYEEMSRLTNILIKKPMEYEGGANARNSFTENVYETGAPLVSHLHYHHEMAYVSKSTSRLSFACKEAVPNKGYSYISSQEQMTPAMLSTPLGQKLKEKGICYVRCLTDRESYANKEEEATVYNHWQKSFGVNTMEEAAAKAAERGLQTEWGVDPVNGNNRYMITRYYVSAFEYCPAVDRNLSYASVADSSMWFDAWPGVMELPHSKRPLKLTFGDDSEMTREELFQWVDMYDDYGMPIKWKKGDVAVICNWRWAHGRPGFTLNKGEQRELGVTLGELFDRVEDLPEKWI